MAFIKNFNLFIFILLTTLYAYQTIYVLIALVGERKKRHFSENAKTQHRFGVIIAARNESAVIAQLIASIKNQHYPTDRLEIFVVADNCTDNTAEIARDAGAVVYERFNQRLVGKGYALDYVFNHIAKDYGDAFFDGYFIFDADNLLDENYVAEMNKVFDSGYRVITSYRNSKNYGSNWISAGYSLWFLREAKYLNNPRMMVGTSCAVSGTGFLVSSEIIRQNNGWKYHLLTEDIEFSIASVIKGETIGYCEKAIIYDEQPISFHQSWTQRMRWCKGFYQVISKYGGDLVAGMFRKESGFLPCYDMLMTIAPATLLSLFCILVNGAFLFDGLFGARFMRHLVLVTSQAIWLSLFNFYITLYFMGILTTITEWRHIKCGAFKKIFYTFTFPIFIFTYVPISIAALFKKVHWQPIAHNVVKSLDEVR